MKTCVCGRPITFRPNSTIQPKFCPSCALENLKARTARNGALSPTIRKKVNKYTSGKNNSSEKRKKEVRYVRTADEWFSRWVRLRDCIVRDGEAYTRDIITGKLYNVKKIDCGHFFSRRHKGTRYEPDNCRPQNASSNRFAGEADKLIFERNLRAEIGQERLDQLKDLAMSTVHMSDKDYEDVATHYRGLVNAILKKKGIKRWWGRC